MVTVTGVFTYERHAGYLLSPTKACNLFEDDKRASWEDAIPLRSHESTEKLYKVEFESPKSLLVFLTDLLLENIRSTVAYTKPGLVIEIEVEVTGELQAPETFTLCCGPGAKALKEEDQVEGEGRLTR